MLRVLKRTLNDNCSFKNPKHMLKLMDKDIFTELECRLIEFLAIYLAISDGYLGIRWVVSVRHCTRWMMLRLLSMVVAVNILLVLEGLPLMLQVKAAVLTIGMSIH